MSMADRHLATGGDETQCGVSGNFTLDVDLVSCSACKVLHEERLALIEVMASSRAGGCTESMLADAVIKAGFRRMKAAAPEHELTQDGASWVCTCGWQPQLGTSVRRSFDAHLREETTSDE